MFLYVLSYDLWFYLSHVALHRWFYSVHRLHHAVDPATMKYPDTYVAHWVEGPFQGLGVLVPLLVRPVNLDLLYALIFINLRGMLRHDVRCTWLIGGHHLLHHKFPQWNYGEYWIDVLMGTNLPQL